MSAAQIIERVLRVHRMSEADFYGRRMLAEQVAARAHAITELTAAGLSKSAIARAIRRDRGTVRYWQSAEIRAHKAEYYRIYNSTRPRSKGGQPCAVPKTTSEQRAQLLDLLLAGRKAEIREYQAELGVAPTYTRRLASKRRCSMPVLERIKLKKRTKAEKLVVAKKVRRVRERTAPEPSPRQLAQQALIDAARERRSAPRSLTAIAFGDPPPGFSALDRRNGEARV